MSGPLNAALPIGQGLLTQHPESTGDEAEVWPGASGEGKTGVCFPFPRVTKSSGSVSREFSPFRLLTSLA